MNFRKVLTVGAEFLPDEGDGVEAEHLDPAIGQHTHQVEEFAENVRVSPVEIPLEFVEGRPYPPLAVVVPGEIAMREVRKNVRKVLLPGVNLVLSRQNMEIVAVLLLTSPSSSSPFMLGRYVVNDEVHDEGYAVGTQGSREVS